MKSYCKAAADTGYYTVWEEIKDCSGRRSGEVVEE